MPYPKVFRWSQLILILLCITTIVGCVGVRTQELDPVREPKVGSCECPYDRTQSGRKCGGNSAYSRGGGERPICYVGEEQSATNAPTEVDDGSSSVHLRFGNPSKANTNPRQLENLLLLKPEFSVSYNCSKGTPNWVSWVVNQSWLGDIDRQDDFRPDQSLSEGCPLVTPTDYRNSGYDRGHVAPSGDRTSSVEANSATFLMTNMIPQSPPNNREVWRELENYSRELVGQGKELHIIAGPVGELKTIGQRNVVVPTQTWKVILVLDRPDDQVTSATRVIAISLPNDDTVANTSWQDYRVSVDEIEKVTGYDFFAAVPVAVQTVIEAKVDDRSS